MTRNFNNQEQVRVYSLIWAAEVQLCPPEGASVLMLGASAGCVLLHGCACSPLTGRVASPPPSDPVPPAALVLTPGLLNGPPGSQASLQHGLGRLCWPEPCTLTRFPK